MTVITVIKIIAFIIFIISCITIYHNTNSYEPSKRIIYIILGTLAVYLLTSFICNMKAKGVSVQNEEAVNDVLSVVKAIFTPINSIIILSTLGNTFGKVKDKVIDTDKAGKRLVIIAVVFLLIIIFEANYIGNFIENLLG